MRARTGLDIDEIEQVEVAVQSEYMNICGIDRPETGLEGKFSLRFCSALALAGEDTARIETYSDDNVRAPTLVRLAEVTRIDPRRDMKLKVADVAVRMRDGVIHRQSADVGVPATDLGEQWRKLEAKFMSCATPVIGVEKAAAAVEAVRTFDRADDVHALMATCA